MPSVFRYVKFVHINTDESFLKKCLFLGKKTMTLDKKKLDDIIQV